ncbi:MAG: hypothetical protein JWO50_580 [Candidatus Kaiserbacteria bacterium]|nr:hypothetical protein [Candidatus Kaiserbacteria bacterium]
MSWISNNIIGIIGIVVGGFIAYHVYFLSLQLNLKDKLVYKDSVRKKVEPLLARINNGISSKCELVNVKKYLKYYPHNNDLNKDGYTYLGAELKALQFDGVEFFCGVRELFKKPDGSYTLKKEESTVREEYNALEAGVIPYEWIEYIDGRGDEYSYRPQFFTQFKGERKSPYKHLSYYIQSDTYYEGRDPMDFKWRRIEVEQNKSLV